MVRAPKMSTACWGYHRSFIFLGATFEAWFWAWSILIPIGFEYDSFVTAWDSSHLPPESARELFRGLAGFSHCLQARDLGNSHCGSRDSGFGCLPHKSQASPTGRFRNIRFPKPSKEEVPYFLCRERQSK